MKAKNLFPGANINFDERDKIVFMLRGGDDTVTELVLDSTYSYYNPATRQWYAHLRPTFNTPEIVACDCRSCDIHEQALKKKLSKDITAHAKMDITRTVYKLKKAACLKQKL
jgi:hypothetical protein